MNTTRRTSRQGDSQTAPGTISVLGLGYLAAICCGVLMPVIDSTLVAVGMDTLVEAFGSDTITMQWVSTSYLLALTAAVPITNWALGRLDGKHLWMLCLALFVLTSACCAASPTAELLIASRTLQGLAAGVIMPLTQTLPVMEARRRGVTKTAGIVASINLPIALGPVLGPPVGGLILNFGSWHWLFLVNIPLGIVALFLAGRYISAGNRQAEGSAARLDIAGLALISGGLVLVLLGLANIASQPASILLDVMAPIAIGAALLALFCARTLRRSANPLVDIRLLSHINQRASGSASFFFGICLYAAQFVLPLWWQQLRGASVFETGTYMMAQGVGVLVSRLFVTRVIERLGHRRTSVASFILLAATTAVFCLATTAPVPALLALLFVRGIAQGTVNIPINSAIYVGLAPEQIPHATMLSRIMQQVGSSFGTALVAMTLQTVSIATGGTGGSNTLEGFTAAIGVLAAAALIGAVVACALPRSEDDVR